MASTPNAATSVIVTLQQVRPAGGSSERRITLFSDKPVSIGRASRSETKNLSASADNGLFNCPVVSRAHATLEMRTNKWTVDGVQVFIKDCNSMHGTSVNGQKLLAGKPFQLFAHDTVTIGGSVSRAQNNYEGVTLVITSIQTTKPQSVTTTTSKTAQPGISCPSDSESDLEDDSGVEEVHVQSSSVKTTPEQSSTKLVSPDPAVKSPPAAIEIDDDGVSHEPAAPEPKASFYETGVVHDTYNETEVLVDEAPSTPVAPGSFSVADDSGAYDSDQNDYPDDAGDLWSDHDLSSDMDLSDHEAECNLADNEANDGPEVLSKMRHRSYELGRLGDEEPDQQISSPRSPSARSPSHRSPPPPAARPHYDPVRGFQPAEHANGPDNTINYGFPSFSNVPRPYESAYDDILATYGTNTTSGHSSKWDVGPNGSSAASFPTCNIINSFSYGIPAYNASCAPFSPPSLHDSLTRQDNSRSSWLASLHIPTSQLDQDTSSNTLDTQGGPKEAVVPESTESMPSQALGAKRKAADISTDTEVTNPSAGSEEASTQTHSEDTIHQELATAAKEPVPVPQLKKRKIKQPHAPRRSMFRATVTEVSKYAAGAVVGGVSLVALLASPLGARLAEC